MEKKIFEWKEQIENQQILVRDIIDIDSTYEDFEALDDNDDLKINKKSKQKKIKIKMRTLKKMTEKAMMMTNSTFLLQKWKKK